MELYLRMDIVRQPKSAWQLQFCRELFSIVTNVAGYK